MSLATELNRLSGAKTDIAAAITSKGVTVPGATKFDGFAALINNISTAEPDPVYTPPADWIDISDVANGDIAMLVSDQIQGYYAFVCTTSADTYTVTWGDGTSDVYASGATATHQYTRDAGQACSLGYTTFKMTIHPDAGNLLTFKIVASPVSPKMQTYAYLDVAIAATAMTSLNGAFWLNTGAGARCRLLERVRFFGTFPALGDIGFMCSDCRALQSIDLTGLSAVTYGVDAFNGSSSLLIADISPLTALVSAGNMFANCVGLRKFTMNGLSALKYATYMFLADTALEEVSMSGITALTDAGNMFNGCSALQHIDVSSMTAVTTGTYMFANCKGLQSIDVHNLTALTRTDYMFSACTGLLYAYASGLNKVTNAQRTFIDCYSLMYADVSGWTAVTASGRMFMNCYSLQYINSANSFAASADSQFMFAYCHCLRSIDVSIMAAVYDATSMFALCFSLRDANLAYMRGLYNATGMFETCLSLVNLNLAEFGKNTVKSLLTNMFVGCERLKNINMPECKIFGIGAYGVAGGLSALETLTFNAGSPFNANATPINISYNNMSDTQLNTIFTALPTVSGKTINITGCTGAATCDKTIATAKGWTVTG